MSNTHTCQSCGLKHPKVECSGIQHCPNPLCRGSGGAWFRTTLDSYEELKDGRHMVNNEEWLMKGTAYIGRIKDAALTKAAYRSGAKLAMSTKP